MTDFDAELKRCAMDVEAALDALLSSTSLLDVKIGVDHESPLA